MSNLGNAAGLAFSFLQLWGRAMVSRWLLSQRIFP